jgi:hypothetical protein
MDFCQNVTVSGEYHHQQEHVLASPPPCSTLTAAAASNSPLDDLFSAQNTVGLLQFLSCLFYAQFFNLFELSSALKGLAKLVLQNSVFFFFFCTFCVQFFLLVLASLARFCLHIYFELLYVFKRTWKVTIFAGFYQFLSVLFMVLKILFCSSETQFIKATFFLPWYRKLILAWNGCQYL